MLTRIFLAFFTVALVGAFSAPAFAADQYGTAECAQNPHPGCQLLAGRDGEIPVPTPGGDPTFVGRVPSQGGGHTTPPGDRSLDKPDTANCSYVPSDYQPPANAPQPVLYREPAGEALVVKPAVFRPSPLSAKAVAVEPGQGPGAWYVYQCTTNGVRDALYRPPVWIPDAAPGVPAPAPEGL